MTSRRVGVFACSLVGLLLTGFALSVNFPRAAHGFQSDESTYYSLAHSLAQDFDFAYERRDLVRVWKEFPAGPEGIFLKRGKVVRLELSGAFPFVRWVTGDDPRSDRLYYGKAYIYPLVAAPFVWLFGTNGFLVLHASLMTLNVAAAYAFLAARAAPGPALAYALVFFLASAAPVYFVWLSPELFHLSVTLYGLFFWCYKEVAPGRGEGGQGARGFLRSPASDLAAAALLGVATFSKPTHVVLIAPLVGLALWRRQWRHAVRMSLVFAAVVAALFAANVAITGELNYQGGDRKTFYGSTGFPFLTPEATFAGTGIDRATDRLSLGLLFGRQALLDTLPRNLVYFLLGRHTGLVPYFFPGVLCAVLFLLARRRRQAWQWLVAATIAVSTLALLVFTPHTYSGGGGPIGNRYFMGSYPMFLLLTPPLGSAASAVVAAGVGGLFTTQLVFNPFYTSFYPAEHPKHGPYRWLPVELTLVNDLPVNVTPSRIKQPLGGDPPLLAYFLDDNAYGPEGDAFWVRGESRAELIVRAPARPRADGGYDVLRIERLTVEVRSGAAPNRVTVVTGEERHDVEMGPHETRSIAVRPGGGFRYLPIPDHPANYVYLLSIASDTGFVPMFAMGGRDHRFLGAMVRLVPRYVPE